MVDKSFVGTGTPDGLGIAGAILGIGSSLLGGSQASKAADKARREQIRQFNLAIKEQRDAREFAQQRTQPFVDVGTQGAARLQEFLGFPQNPEFTSLGSQIAGLQSQLDALGPSPPSAEGAGFLGKLRTDVLTKADQGKESQRLQLREQISGLQSQQSGLSPTIQGDRLQQLEEINPIVGFLRDQGFEQIQESAAARGKLGAGGTLQDLVRFNTELATTVVPQLQNQRFNQLFNVSGLGATAASGQGQTALSTGANIGNLLGNIGQAQGQGAIQSGQANLNTLGNIAGTAGQFFGSLQPQTQQTPFQFGVDAPVNASVGGFAGAFPNTQNALQDPLGIN